MSATGRPSLASRLLRHVMVPLALTWMFGTAVALGIAQFFTQKALDRSLLDNAQLVATHVRRQGGELTLGLTPREVDTVLYDPTESVFFSVIQANGKVVAGRAGLLLSGASESPYRFEDIDFDGQHMRAVAVHRDGPDQFDVVVAETTVGRVDLLRRLLAWSLAPQMALLVLLAWWLRRAIRSDLEPLAQLQQALNRRDATDLAPVRVEATSSDVDRLAGATNSLFDRLARSVQAQREFAGNVAHELRTPLAGIRALADYGLAQRNPQAWRDQHELIAASEARASRLVDQLLDLALAHEAEAGIRLGPVNLDELVHDAVLRFLPRADAAGVDLGARGIETPARVVADATLVEGILNNLLDNALRYGVDNRSEQPAVTVGLERQADLVVLSVQDNGSGLPGEMQARLMERGAQGETGQLLGQGAGLGLALVSQYARLMQATVSLGGGPGGRGWVCTIAFAASA